MFHWQRQGSGADVVLVHGFLGSSKIFQPLTQALAECFRVTTIDLPGCGASYDVAVPPTVEALAGQVADTIRASGLERCAILGHSLGAWVALEIALQQPALLQKMVLYGGSADGICPQRFETYENSIERLRAQGVKAFAASLAAEWFRYGRDDPMYPLAVEAGSHSNEAAAIAHHASWNSWRTSHRLAEVETSTLLVCGDCDRSTHPDLSIDMWRRLADAHLFILPNAGHAAHLEHPAAFNATVMKFLQ